MTIENQKPGESKNIVHQVIQTLVAVIEEKNVFCRGHANLVASNCVLFSKKIGLDQKEIEKIYLAALLRDIGMVYLPVEIIQKPGKLTPDEKKIVEQHPSQAEKLLGHLEFLADILPLIRHHHEACDGSGYPDKLTGDKIPIGAQIIALADAYYAMTADRPNRAAMEAAKAVQIIEKSKGGKFDEKLTVQFIEYLQKPAGEPESDSPEVNPEMNDQDTEAEQTSFDDIINNIVRRFKRGEVELPVLPKIVQDIQTAIADQQSTIDDLVEIIEKDAIISIRLISTANSPLYIGQEKIRAVREAIPRIGLQETQSIVAAIVNKNLYDSKLPDYVTLMEKLWLHSLACAYAGRAIAQAIGGGLDPEKLFLMGLLHDIGKVMIVKDLGESGLEKNLEISGLINRMHDIHCNLGGLILHHWKFTKEFIEVTAGHEASRFNSATPKAVLIINLANHLTRNIGYSVYENETNFEKLDSAKRLGMDSETLSPIAESVEKMMQESAHAF